MAILQILNTLGSIFLIGRQMARTDDLQKASNAQEELGDSVNDFQAKVGDWERCRTQIEEAREMAESLRADIMSLTEDTVQPACEVLLETTDLTVGTGSNEHTINKNAMNTLIEYLSEHNEICDVSGK